MRGFCKLAQADIERLPEILLAVPEARLQAMQAAVRSVWQRFMWSSLPIFNGIVRDVLASNAAQNASMVSPDACCAEADRDDAFATVMQWLSWKAAGQNSAAGAAASAD